jgi:hypothetical protein
MEVVYYFDNDLNVCPVKKYLECYIPNKSDKSKIKDRKNHILASIDEKIQYVKENPAGQASFLSTLHGHNFIEIKNRKDKNTVIRILYFRHALKIVLLNAFEKSDNYITNKAKKEVDKHYLITDTYVKKFLKKPNSYEPYK